MAPVRMVRAVFFVLILVALVVFALSWPAADDPGVGLVLRLFLAAAEAFLLFALALVTATLGRAALARRFHRPA